MGLWIKQHWKAFLIALVSILGFIAILWLRLLGAKKDAEKAKAELRLLRVGNKVEQIQEIKESRKVELAKNATEARKIDDHLLVLKREAELIKTSVPPEDLAKAFKDLGL